MAAGSALSLKLDSSWIFLFLIVLSSRNEILLSSLFCFVFWKNAIMMFVPFQKTATFLTPLPTMCGFQGGSNIIYYKQHCFLLSLSAPSVHLMSHVSRVMPDHFNLAFPESTPGIYSMGWVWWFSSLLWEVFLYVHQFMIWVDLISFVVSPCSF